MSHDGLEQGMFWAGALMAIAPVLFAGIVLGVWWHQRRITSRRSQAPPDR
jgi:hypothetical protein